MATAARKARKRAGIPFTPKAPKVPTPLMQRAFLTAPVLRRVGDAVPAGHPKLSTVRSQSRIERFLARGGRR